MHEPGVSVYMTEFIPFAKFSELYDISKYCQEEIHASLDYISQNEPVSMGMIGCIVWKLLDKTWKSMSDQNFSTATPRKNQQSLDNDLWFENPLIPDIILKEYYSPPDGTGLRCRPFDLF